MYFKDENNCEIISKNHRQKEIHFGIFFQSYLKLLQLI